MESVSSWPHGAYILEGKTEIKHYMLCLMEIRGTEKRRQGEEMWHVMGVLLLLRNIKEEEGQTQVGHEASGGKNILEGECPVQRSCGQRLLTYSSFQIGVPQISLGNVKVEVPDNLSLGS